MGCNCGSKKKGTINHFSTEQQAAIARQRGGVVTTARSRQTPAAPAKAETNQD